MSEAAALAHTSAADSAAAQTLAVRIALAAFALAAALLIPLAWWVPGLAAWTVSAVLVWRSGNHALRHRMGVLLAAVLVLAVVPIGTNLGNFNFLRVSAGFLAVVVGPWAWLRRHDPGVIEYRVFPRRWSGVEIFYVLLSLPLAWIIVHWYFFVLTPEMPLQWPVGRDSPRSDIWRLFIGINGVGIWDELFFVNTVYAVLRSLFPARWANLAQAVVYTSVLNDMAFIGAGPVIVYCFALTQGIMYERSRALIYVLVVHLIVDAFLVKAILHYHQPASIPFHL